MKQLGFAVQVFVVKAQNTGHELNLNSWINTNKTYGTYEIT